MAATLILKQGDKPMVKPIKIVPTGKEVNKANGHFWQHHITFEDKKGDSVMCEYLSPTDEQGQFYPNVFQYIHVHHMSPKGTPEIEPCEPPMPGNRVALHEVPAQRRPDQPFDDKLCKASNISGSPICYATSYAKDLYAAQIKATHEPVTEEGVRSMMKMAKIISDEMCLYANS